MDVTVVLEKRWVLPALVGGVALASGFAGGYFLGSYRRKKAEEQYYVIEKDEYTETTEEEWPEEGSKAPVFLKSIPQDEEFEALLREEKAIQEAIEAERAAEVEELETTNVFRAPERKVVDENWDFEAEVASRDDLEFYIIHRDEFMNEEADYTQETLTYYSGDDIMADQQDKPIYNYTGLMGELRFGHGSGDPNVVYIRNDAIHMEWEVLFHTSRYEIEVGGLELEENYENNDLKHSVLHKFRDI